MLALTATDDLGNPINLTGAAFVTQILGRNPNGPVSFPTGQHAIINAALGQFTLTLANAGADTTACGVGNNKAILTQITIGSVVTYFPGNNLLSVYDPFPLQ